MKYELRKGTYSYWSVSESEVKMRRKELIACFQNTLQMSKEGNIDKSTTISIQSNKVYKENFISAVKMKCEHGGVSVYSETTFHIAKSFCQFGRVAVLNFANPEYPGGGIWNGAMAQEECLCRSSNLYACISNENVFEEFYDYHRDLKNHFYSDRLIYTKDVLVFKNDDAVPQLLPQENWFNVDVITCAAPYIAKRKYTNSTALLSLLKKRIKNIFEAARDNNVDVIVLGAFGCGAFKNPPLIVASAFKQVMEENNYFTAFKQIVFAIKPTGNMCSNLMTFREQFSLYIAEGECCLLQYPVERRFTRMPTLFKERFVTDEQKFFSWQEKNIYYGKQFAIIGDSISTLEGYNPRGYKVFYTGENCEKSNVICMEDTWWDKVISYFGGELLINNSWSGSRVTKLSNSKELFPSGCSDERTSSLHINDVKPDIIIVYLGTNDWAFGVNTGSETRILRENDNEFFSDAYDIMLKKLIANYPKSEIWCCTLSETYISKNSNFSFPHSYAGTHIEEYNDIIREAVKRNSCNLIDLYEYKMPYDTIDGSHPTSDGMNTIAEMIISSMAKKECLEDEHEYELIGQNGDYDFYKCTKCGKEVYIPLWSSLNDDIAGASKPMLFKMDKTIDINPYSIDKTETLQDKYIGKTISDHCFNSYHVIKLLVESSFYKTYLLEDAMLKKMWIMNLWDKANKNYNIQQMETILQKAHKMMILSHPVIPLVVDVLEDEDNIFIVKEYIEGESLESIVKKFGGQPAWLVIEWAKELCDMLRYLHNLTPPYSYRSMEPANVFVMKNQHLKVMDFGIVKMSDLINDKGTSYWGTIGYSAPEEFGGCGRIDARTDIFKLGMTMYYLITGINPGKPPYEIGPIRQIKPSLPKGLEYIISKCIEPNRDNRYQNCDELMNDLNNYMNLPTLKGIFGKLFRKKKS